jgi:tRNA pseudouridine55 synthase
MPFFECCKKKRPVTSGFLNLLKPPGMTSFDVIRMLNRQVPSLKLGHSGTLDLPACGVLVLAVGKATKFLPYLLEEKEYLFEVVFGLETDTGDFWGKIVRTSREPIQPSSLEKILPQFHGPLVQEVPSFSAKHHERRRLYQMAVQEVEPPVLHTSAVEVFSLRLLDFLQGTYPRARFWAHCSGGTYVRALARDIGKALDSAACARFIVRLCCSGFHLEESVTLEEISHGCFPLLPVEQGLSHLPLEVLADTYLANFTSGKPVPTGQTGGNGLFRVCDRRSHFLGVGKRQSERLLVAERLWR